MALKLNEYESELIEEISTLAGYSESTVRDIQELTLFRQLEDAMREKDIRIPFIGKLHVVHHGDTYVNGTREANVECFFAPSDLFKRIIGDIVDGDSELLADLLQKKIGAVLQEKLETGRN